MPEKPFLTLCPQWKLALKRNVAILINMKRGKDSSQKITICVSLHVLTSIPILSQKFAHRQGIVYYTFKFQLSSLPSVNLQMSSSPCSSQPKNECSTLLCLALILLLPLGRSHDFFICEMGSGLHHDQKMSLNLTDFEMWFECDHFCGSLS